MFDVFVDVFECIPVLARHKEIHRSWVSGRTLCTGWEQAPFWESGEGTQPLQPLFAIRYDRLLQPLQEKSSFKLEEVFFDLESDLDCVRGKRDLAASYLI